MSANIKILMASSRLEVGAGEAVETTISLKNQSQIVDQFAIKIEGLDPLWWSLSTSSVSLFPGDQDEIKLTIRPPRDAEARAGSYEFRVKVISQSNTQDFTSLEGYLILRGFTVWEVEMSPSKVKGQSGVYHIKLINNGNADILLNFECKDPEEELIFKFDKNTVSVPAGDTAQVDLTVKPKKGEAKKIYSFQVMVKSDQVRVLSRETKTVSGQLEYPKRKFPWWIIILILGLLALSAVAYFAFNYKTITPPPPPPPPQIVASLIITSPKAGASWQSGTTQTIRWTSTSSVSTTANLEYSTDGGVTYAGIINNAPNTGTYSWKVTGKVSNKCLVRGSLISSQGETLATATSGNFSIFTFPGSIRIITPLP